MPGQLNLYNLGLLGVNVTKSPVHLDDGELTQAQNAIPDPRSELGALKTRYGLTQLNSVATSGSLQGALQVGLPAVTTRTVYIGRQDTADDSLGWQTSTDAFATASTLITGGTPANPVGFNQVILGEPSTTGAGNFTIVGRTATVWNNKLIYAADTYTVGTNAPPIRIFDGTVDIELSRVPSAIFSGTSFVSEVIKVFLTVGDTIYVGVCDGDGAASGDFRGRVFQLNPVSGSMTQLGGVFGLDIGAALAYPMSLAWSLGRLWCGTRGGNSVSEGTVHYFRPNVDTEWTQDRELAVNAGFSCAPAMADFRGNLYVASTVDNNAIAALIETRNTDGTWSTSLTGASATAFNGFSDLIVFNDALYASYYADSVPTGTIHTFDGTSWTTAFTATGSLRTPYRFFIHNSVLYAIGVIVGAAGTRNLLTTTNGSTWTDRTANVSNEHTSAIGAIVT